MRPIESESVFQAFLVSPLLRVSSSRTDTRARESLTYRATPLAPCSKGNNSHQKLPQCVLCVVAAAPRRLKSASRPRALLVRSFHRRTSIIQPRALPLTQHPIFGQSAGARAAVGARGTRRGTPRDPRFCTREQAARTACPRGQQQPRAAGLPRGSLTPRRGGDDGQALF